MFVLKRVDLSQRSLILHDLKYYSLPLPYSLHWFHINGKPISFNSNIDQLLICYSNQMLLYRLYHMIFFENWANFVKHR